MHNYVVCLNIRCACTWVTLVAKAVDCFRSILPESIRSSWTTILSSGQGRTRRLRKCMFSLVSIITLSLSLSLSLAIRSDAYKPCDLNRVKVSPRHRVSVQARTSSSARGATSIAAMARARCKSQIFIQAEVFGTSHTCPG